MLCMKNNWKNYLYLWAILFFALGLFNIVFAWLGFVCMILPFILLARNKKKTWCQGYCPRANLFDVLFRGRSLTGKSGPRWLVKGNTKWVMLVYFAFNLFILVMSTIMVYRGRIEAMEKIRFLIAFQLPWDIPQLLQVGFVPEWALHLSFRIYSMMFTTTVLGLVLSWLFKPRTWCTICPINTVSDISVKAMRAK